MLILKVTKRAEYIRTDGDHRMVITFEVSNRTKEKDWLLNIIECDIPYADWEKYSIGAEFTLM
jgi:hypothetical protein